MAPSSLPKPSNTGGSRCQPAVFRYPLKHLLLTLGLSMGTIAALGGYSVPVGAESLPAQSPLHFQLEELRSGEQHHLARFAGSPLFLIFFEPRCPWCAKQISTLQGLLERCPNKLRAVAVGVHGDLPGYRRFLRRAQVEIPAYRASPQLQAAIGGVPATPYTLFLDATGRPTHRLRGAIAAPQLSQWLAAQEIPCPAGD